MVFFILFEGFFMAANFGGLALGMQFAGGSLGGWTTTEVMFVVALYNFGHQIFTSICISGLFHTGWFVWSGRMDYVLLKPLHPLLAMHAANEFIISNIPNVVLSFGILLTTFVKLSAEGMVFSAINLAGLLLFFLAGFAVRYGVAILAVGPAFFAEKLAEGEDAYWALQSLGKFPTGVFPRSMQWLLSFVLPIASIAAIPASVFFGKEQTTSAVLHFIIAVTFSYGAIKFYELGARRYQSVNTGA
jgi:ABC-2 type transport system permease protein